MDLACIGVGSLNESKGLIGIAYDHNGGWR